MKVKDFMTKKVITANENEKIRDVVLRLRERNVSGVPVLNDEGKLVGVFCESDLLSQLPDILHEAEQIPLVDVKELTDAPVKTIMGKPPITIGPEDSLKKAAELFLTKFIHRLPVIENDTLVGIISLGDVLKAFIENDKCD
ncbi:CBS domain-containing protein [Deferribacter autotrophicus]|uniref:CBS domain-containing protein n=1 Tax=Deferribacter autotrophicus TaxID=500465 RepID=A0A5A8F349_9BACT|nr:CBS domain-containing protein [Deferribacter autotrophicus]KAA0258223.1 CBS domain-containing protein [Deferribacter autotrophicus]